MTVQLVIGGGSSGIISQRKIDLGKNPAPAIMAHGIGAVNNTTQYWIEIEDEMDGRKFLVEEATGLKNIGQARGHVFREVLEDPFPTISADRPVRDAHGPVSDKELFLDPAGKPPYRVPTMAEVGAVPSNRLTLVSTFSGAGGSCLGFRMAGFETLWASEFIPAAREVYELNYPDVPVDVRDIRKVHPGEILRATGLARGELDVLEGSPPCASFSTAGRRDATWGQVRNYSDTRQRVDDLFFEFIRLVDGLQPRVFVAENVSGLIKGKAKGYFKDILAAMESRGYQVTARLLDAQWLGVPQQRQRVIFIGVRKDLDMPPVYPRPLAYRYSVREAIPWIIKHETAPLSTIIQSGTDKGPRLIEVARVIEDTGGEWGAGDVTEKPSPTIRQGGSGHLYVVEPETDMTGYAVGKEWDRLEPGQGSDKYLNLKRLSLDEPSGTVTQMGGQNPGVAAVAHPTERRKFSIAELKRVCAFPDDFELTGSYAKQWERLGRAVPPVMMFHVARTVRDKILFPLDGREPWVHDPPCLVTGLAYAAPETREERK